MPPSLETEQPARRAKYWLWGVLAIYFVMTALNPSIIGTPTTDFKSYFVAASCWHQGANPYDFQELSQTAASRSDVTGILYPYLYPPTLAMLLVPATKVDLWWASLAWHLLSVGLTAGVVLLSIRLCRAVVPFDSPAAGSSIFLPLVAVGLLFVLPFSLQYEWGQANVLVMVFIVLALVRCYEGNRDLSAGVLLAAAALIKVTPAYLLLYFVCQRRWKVVLGFLIGAAVMVAPMLLLPAGRTAWVQFFEFLPSTGYGKTIAGLYPPLGPANFSVAGFWSRLTTNPTMVAALTYLCLLALVALVVLMHYRLRGKPGTRLLLLPHLVIMVVAAPYAYLHHVTFIYPGLLLTAYALLQQPASKCGKRALLVLIASTLLACIFFPRLYSFVGLHYAFRSINLVGLIGLYVVGVWIAARSERGE